MEKLETYTQAAKRLEDNLTYETGIDLGETEYVRIFLSSKKEAFVEITFDNRLDSSPQLDVWTWNNGEETPREWDGFISNPHDTYPDIVSRGCLGRDSDISELATMGSYMTSDERYVFIKLFYLFQAHCKENSMRYILGGL